MSTVLLVEDSATDAAIISSYLKQAYVGVVTASSSEEAQEKLMARRPDLVLLDVILPGQSGFEWCQELKSNPDTKDIPVVLCSTKGTDADRIWGSMLGADAYLAKPVDGSELLSTIKRLLM